MIRASRATGRTQNKRTSLGRAKSKKISRIKTPISTWKNGRSPIPTSQLRLDAFATDDILLYGLIALHKAQDRFRVAGDYLFYDPYGIMFRKGEPQLTAVVERTFRKLGTDRDLIPLYNKWFVARLPTGEKLNVAISPQLEEAFKALNDAEGTSN
jgi:hypothetical protein